MHTFNNECDSMYSHSRVRERHGPCDEAFDATFHRTFDRAFDGILLRDYMTPYVAQRASTMRIDMCMVCTIDMRRDKCIEMRIEMRIEMFIDMCIEM